MNAQERPEVGVDLDEETLEWGRANNLAALGKRADRGGRRQGRAAVFWLVLPLGLVPDADCALCRLRGHHGQLAGVDALARVYPDRPPVAARPATTNSTGDLTRP